jgi:hypothetical protein
MFRKLTGLFVGIVFGLAASISHATIIEGTNYTLTERTTGFDLSDTGTVTIGNTGNDGASVTVTVIEFFADFLTTTRVEVGYQQSQAGVSVPFDLDITGLTVAPGLVLSGISIASDPNSILMSASVISTNAFGFTFATPSSSLELQSAQLDLQFAQVPVPGGLALLPGGLAALVWMRRARRIARRS